MKNFLLTVILLMGCSAANCQKFGGNENSSRLSEEEGPKLLYNYTYASYYTSSIGSPGSYLIGFNSVTYISNGRQQFGIGTGITIHNSKSDSGNMQFISVPLFLSNKFFITQDDNMGGYYVDFQAGFNLPVSATYITGENSGNLVPAEKIRSTGFFGLSVGRRMLSKRQKSICYIVEIGYRSEPVPYVPPGNTIKAGLFGFSAGLSF